MIIQPLFSCVPAAFSNIESAISKYRLSRYMSAAKNDRHMALRLYIWNIRICESFYLPVQFAEVGARNAIMVPVNKRFKAQWYDAPAFQNILTPRFQNELKETVAKQKRKHGQAMMGHHVVSALSLGFWVEMMSASYDQHLWANGIHNSFPGAAAGTNRAELFLMLEDMRRLRNAVMHHEALFDRSPQMPSSMFLCSQN